jgi:hypothetical protein
MLLCNYVFLQPRVPPLPFPSSIATVSPPSVVVLLVIVVLVREFAPAPAPVIVVVLVHPVPCCWWRTLESRTPAHVIAIVVVLHGVCGSPGFLRIDTHPNLDFNLLPILFFAINLRLVRGVRGQWGWSGFMFM